MTKLSKKQKIELNDAIEHVKALINNSRGQESNCRVWDSTFKESLGDYKQSVAIYSDSWILKPLERLLEVS